MRVRGRLERERRSCQLPSWVRGRRSRIFAFFLSSFAQFFALGRAPREVLAGLAWSGKSWLPLEEALLAHFAPFGFDVTEVGPEGSLFYLFQPAGKWCSVLLFLEITSQPASGAGIDGARSPRTLSRTPRDCCWGPPPPSLTHRCRLRRPVASRAAPCLSISRLEAAWRARMC